MLFLPLGRTIFAELRCFSSVLGHRQICGECATRKLSAASINTASLSLMLAAQVSQKIKIHLHADNCLYRVRPKTPVLCSCTAIKAQPLPARVSSRFKAIISSTRKSLSIPIISAKSLWHSSLWHVARQTEGCLG